jgi:hypothetical protein
MRRFALGFLAAAAIAGLYCAAAFAASIRDSGKVKHAPASTVSLKVVIRQGKLIKVTNFSVTGVPTHCQGGPGKVSEQFGVYPGGFRGPPPPTLKIAKDGKFSGKFVPSTMPPGQFFKVSGTVKDGGKTAFGTLSISSSNPPPTGVCMTGTRSWSAKAS